MRHQLEHVTNPEGVLSSHQRYLRIVQGARGSGLRKKRPKRVARCDWASGPVQRGMAKPAAAWASEAFGVDSASREELLAVMLAPVRGYRSPESLSPLVASLNERSQFVERRKPSVRPR